MLSLLQSVKYETSDRNGDDINHLIEAASFYLFVWAALTQTNTYEENYRCGVTQHHFDRTKLAREGSSFSGLPGTNGLIRIIFLIMRQGVSFFGLLHAMKGGV